MDEFEIEVVGTTAPRKPDAPPKRLIGRIKGFAHALLMRPRAVAVAGALVFALAVGTPHVGWDYRCRHPMRPGQPCRAVEYCAYYGIQGRRVVFPGYGESCQVIKLLRIDWRRIG